MVPLLWPVHLHSRPITRLSLVAGPLPIVLFIVCLVKTVDLSKGVFGESQRAAWERERFGFVLGGSGEGPGSVWGGMCELAPFSRLLRKKGGRLTGLA